MGIRVEFIEPYSEMCKDEFGYSEIKLDGNYWEIIATYPDLKSNLKAWEAYYAITDCDFTKRFIKWIIDNWDPSMIECIG